MADSYLVIRRFVGTLGAATFSSAPISLEPAGRGWPSQSSPAAGGGVAILFSSAVASV
jgi:hypothetical protein